jgi:hypothetical protein
MLGLSIIFSESFPFYVFRNYRHIQTQSPPPPKQSQFGGADAVFTHADIKTRQCQSASVAETNTVGGMLV